MMVSVIIPCFNSEKWITETLDSVFIQDLNILQEVIVVDDGSTDNSQKTIERYSKNVKLISTENQGPSKARNIGTQESSGEYVLYLDSDDLLADGKLRKQFDLLENTGADVAYGNWQKMKKNEKGEYCNSDIVRRKLKNPEIELFGNFWCPPAVYLFRRSIVDKIGGWNEELPIIQDARFALDCALHGGKFQYCDEIMAYYRIHNSDSVSKKDPIAFVRDCYINACQIENWWIVNGGLTKERKIALENALGYVTRASYIEDKETFQNAYLKLIELNNNYIPQKGTVSENLVLISKLFGYKNALLLSSYYDKIKRIFQ